MNDATTTAPAQLRERVISGSVWTIASYGASQVLRLAGNLVFAKLLFPEAFGLLALVNIFVQGLTLFSDIGIGPSIIQSRRGEDLDFLNTAWTIQVFRGVALWVVSLLGAAPFAAWYGEPQLASLIPVAALASIISGFSSTRIFTAGRRIALGRVTLIDFAGQTLGLLTMLVWCIVSPSVWAIVFGGLAGTTAKTVLTHIALDGERNRLRFDREASRELFKFGRWVFVSTALSFLTLQVDRLMLGKAVPLGMLGVYSIAMSLASVAPMVAGNLAASVLFPLLAHHSRTDNEAYERAIYSARRVILQGALFMLAGLALLSPAFFHALYDQRYAEAAWMAQLLTVPMWIWMLMISADRAVLAVGDSRTLALSNAASLLGKLGACYAGFRLAGIPGFILGLALGILAGHVPIVLALRKLGIRVLQQDLRFSALALASIGGGVLLQRWAVAALEGRWKIAAEFGVALLVLVPLGLQAGRNAKRMIARR
jgi:O-antigen/teichoic acid export membrane protein